MCAMNTQVAWQYFNIGDDDQFSHQVVSFLMGLFAADYYALQQYSDCSDQFQPRTDQHVLNASWTTAKT